MIELAIIILIIVVIMLASSGRKKNKVETELARDDLRQRQAANSDMVTLPRSAYLALKENANYQYDRAEHLKRQNEDLHAYIDQELT